MTLFIKCERCQGTSSDVAFKATKYAFPPGQHPMLPSGWIEFEGKHLCEACARLLRKFIEKGSRS